MALETLRVENLRCLAEAHLGFDPGLTLIEGPNGSGKTSLLEAIFLLGRGRSFRTHQTERLIRHGAASLLAYGETAGHPGHRVGLRYARNRPLELHVDGEGVRSRSVLPTVFFVEVVDPDVHRLVEGAPLERRRWLDWVVFHVEPRFLDSWTRYNRALRQRNAALRSGGDPRPWNVTLATHGEEVARWRAEGLAPLVPLVSRAFQSLGLQEVHLSLARGWPDSLSLAEALTQGLERDRARGATRSGPHRADVALKVDGRVASEVLSRGQQKLLGAALVLAAIERLRGLRGIAPTLLLDDPAAELDAERVAAFAAQVRALDCQLVVTSLAPGNTVFGKPNKAFHVEQGRVVPL